MISAKSLADHISSAIAEGKYFERPFPLYIFKPFPDELYEELLKQIPDTSFYKPLSHPDSRRPDGSITRFLMSLTQQRFMQLPAGQAAFWGPLSAALTSAEVKEVIFERLQSELFRRFGRPWREIQSLPAPRLMRDTAGYRISIHPDHPNKVVTWQIYLPKDHSQEAFGTSIYSHNDHTGFQFEQKLSFSPNTAYCFAVTERSWHGVDEIGEMKLPRDSLIIHYFQEPDQEF